MPLMSTNFGPCHNTACEYSKCGRCICPRKEWLCDLRANAVERDSWDDENEADEDEEV